MAEHPNRASAQTAPQSVGRFLVIEGPDGAGCSTQVRLLGNYLAARGIKRQTTKEPTDGPIGAEIRKALQLQIRMNPHALALAFAADRAYHCNHVRFQTPGWNRVGDTGDAGENMNTGIRTLLASGIWVISDRYVLSSLVYQTMQGLDSKWVTAINDHTELVRPDATILISAPVSVYRQRLEMRSTHLELFDGVDELTAVQRTYDEMIDVAGPRFTGSLFTVEGTGSPEEVHSRIVGQLSQRFSELAF